MNRPDVHGWLKNLGLGGDVLPLVKVLGFITERPGVAAEDIMFRFALKAVEVAAYIKCLLDLGFIEVSADPLGRHLPVRYWVAGTKPAEIPRRVPYEGDVDPLPASGSLVAHRVMRTASELQALEEALPDAPSAPEGGVSVVEGVLQERRLAAARRGMDRTGVLRLLEARPEGAFARDVRLEVGETAAANLTQMVTAGLITREEAQPGYRYRMAPKGRAYLEAVREAAGAGSRTVRVAPLPPLTSRRARV